MKPKSLTSVLALCSIAALSGCGKTNELSEIENARAHFINKCAAPMHQEAQAIGDQISLEKFQAVCACAYDKVAQTQENPTAWAKAVASYNEGNYNAEVMIPMGTAIGTCSQQLLS